MPKQSKPKLKTDFGFSSGTGSPVYTEVRGIRTIQWDLSDKATRVAIENGPEHLKIASEILRTAHRILADASLPDLEEAIHLADTIEARGENRMNALAAACAVWMEPIARKYGMLAPETLAARFLGKYQTVVEDLIGPQPQSANDRARIIQDRLVAIFGLCDAWYGLHLEQSGAHESAAAGQQTAKNLAAAGGARSEKKNERIGIVTDWCKQSFAKGDFNAANLARRYAADINKALQNEGHEAYALGSLEKAIGTAGRYYRQHKATGA